ncbi:Holliday junction branch migration protein RuvA [Mycoplasmopsis iners]|uniref:Holliday junction branch migration protein RuvA n=1 Tax=Mycoplasmopsis iners TaxID=76630 RepID=UPI000496D634|nr:Holliday junction branch migration protein RuvA [Mycoplasmopsis iners]
MVLYRVGEIIYKNGNNLIFESQGVGYSIIVPCSERFEPKMRLKLYLHEIKNDYLQATYGFKDFKERLLFLDLIAMQGIGPRVACSILNKGWETVANLIANGQSEELNGIQYISPKIARSVVNELQSKWSKMLTNSTNKKEIQANLEKNNNILEVKETLKMLGFKNNQIEKAIDNLNVTNDIEEMVETAIKFISKDYEQTNLKTA